MESRSSTPRSGELKLRSGRLVRRGRRSCSGEGGRHSRSSSSERHASDDFHLAYSRDRSPRTEGSNVKRLSLVQDRKGEDSFTWNLDCGTKLQREKHQLVIDDTDQSGKLAEPAGRWTSSLEKLYDLLQATLGDEGTGDFLNYAMSRKRDTTEAAPIQALTLPDKDIEEEDRMKMLKMRQKPQSFSGKGQPVTAWINSMELYFRRAKIPPSMKLSIAESFLEGDALNWYMGLITHDSLCEWEEFSKKLRINYGGVSPLAAREKLRKVRMTGSLEEYIAEFNRVRLDCAGLPPGEEIEMFVDGLHPEIMKLMATQSPSTKEEAIELAHTFNYTRERIDRWRRAGGESRTGDYKSSLFAKPYPGRGVASGRTRQTGSGAHTSAQDGRRNVSKKDQASQRKFSSPKMSPEGRASSGSAKERAERATEGQMPSKKGPLICWKCGREGHPRALCPSPSN